MDVCELVFMRSIVRTSLIILGLAMLAAPMVLMAAAAANRVLSLGNPPDPDSSLFHDVSCATMSIDDLGLGAGAAVVAGTLIWAVVERWRSV